MTRHPAISRSPAARFALRWLRRSAITTVVAGALVLALELSGRQQGLAWQLLWLALGLGVFGLVSMPLVFLAAHIDERKKRKREDKP